MVGPADGREEGASEGRKDGSRDGETLGMLDGTLEGVEEGGDDSASDGFELGFWLTVGASDADNDGAPLGLVEGDDVVGATRNRKSWEEDIVRELVPSHIVHIFLKSKKELVMEKNA